MRIGEFTLTSGQTSSYYVDIKRASTEPGILREIARQVAPYTDGADRVAGMVLGAVPLAVAVSLEAGLPSLLIRKGKRDHGTGQRIEGAYEPGDRVLLVEDVTSTGGSSLDAVEVLRAADLVVDTCVSVVDRDMGATKLLADEGVTLVSLVSAAEILEDDA